MTKDTLSQIRARAEKASPAPWRNCDWDPMEPPHVAWKSGPVCDSKSNVSSKEDREFISHARQDIPALLAHIDKLERVADAARGLWRAYSVADTEDCTGTWKDWEPLDAALRGLEESA